MTRPAACCSLFACVALLVACGNKGPLYVPVTEGSTAPPANLPGKTRGLEKSQYGVTPQSPRTLLPSNNLGVPPSARSTRAPASASSASMPAPVNPSDFHD